MNRMVMEALVAVLTKYPMKPGEKIPWVYEKVADEKRQLPFFSWHISVPHQRILWKQVNGEFYTKTIQVKIHAADPLEANDRIEWMQNILNSMQPQLDLAQKGISVISVSDPEPLDEDWTISIENQVGTNVRLMVNSNYHDNTQSGEIAAVEPNYTIKKEES
ncbi:phage neck terminator protein [Levilactobacillus spicheri]|uniref:Phage tail protein n=3 Tax=Levilactobacillus spicheri TaxID=216463 RepID=A0ABQ0WQE1_9LACO|nr:hypothetical protein [Levilactobacillus spicheri]GEO67308.1 hypothetical protein LSP04_17270 [Levilactobacillus spicheri]